MLAAWNKHGLDASRFVSNYAKVLERRLEYGLLHLSECTLAVFRSDLKSERGFSFASLVHRLIVAFSSSKPF